MGPATSDRLCAQGAQGRLIPADVAGGTSKGGTEE